MSARRVQSCLTAIAISLCLSACATVAEMDRTELSSYEPVRSEPGIDIVKFRTKANAFYREDSQEAERVRMNWLEQYLGDNGLAGRQYEILSRKTVLLYRAPLGDGYDIFYEVKVLKR